MVTLYKENRIDQAELHRPEKLAKDFVATLRGEMHQDYKPSGSLRVDDQFIWWLSDPKGMNATWKPESWTPMIDALATLMDTDGAARRIVLDALSRGH